MNEKYLIEKISFYKLWLTLLVAIDASTSAWFYQNLKTVNTIEKILIFLFILAVAVIIFIITYKSRKLIKKLGAL